MNKPYVIASASQVPQDRADLGPGHPVPCSSGTYSSCFSPSKSKVAAFGPGFLALGACLKFSWRERD